MTALQLLILSTIHRHGPQTMNALWHNTKCQALTAINLEIATLESKRLIENTPTHLRPIRYFTTDPISYWQLTEKGRRLIVGKAQQQQEVCLGSK